MISICVSHCRAWRRRFHSEILAHTALFFLPSMADSRLFYAIMHLLMFPVLLLDADGGKVSAPSFLPPCRSSAAEFLGQHREALFPYG